MVHTGIGLDTTGPGYYQVSKAKRVKGVEWKPMTKQAARIAKI